MSEQNSRREFLQKGFVSAAGLTLASTGAAALPEQDYRGTLEWRNKQPGMAYRRLW
jgi:hypothetical protein